MTIGLNKRAIVIWQLIFLAAGMTWLLAPDLNHVLSYRTALISQYENISQPYSWLFRLGDIVAGLAIVFVARLYNKQKPRRIDAILLLVIGIGMVIDPIFTTTCHVKGSLCVEHISFSFLVHATETVITSMAIFALIAYDAYKNHRAVSYVMLAGEFLYGCLYVSGFAETQHFSTLAQYIYECASLIWIAWYVRETLSTDTAESTWLGVGAVRYAAAIWAFISGMMSILVSLAHIHVVGSIHGLYFAGDNAWLAQHGVIAGVVMLYLSRHLQRGELRARQLFLILVAVETLKYAVIAPDIKLMLLYATSFVLLFVSKDEFRRGIIPVTWRIKLKELVFMLTAILVTAAAGLIMLDSDDQASIIARHSFGNFQHYALHSDAVKKSHVLSALLADTITVFMMASLAVILWILFKPNRVKHADSDTTLIHQQISKYSNSTEDYFKVWPPDKNYFWDSAHSGFVAYKIQGSIAFALADPIGPNRKKTALEFMQWCRHQRLTACFLPVSRNSLSYYQDLNKIQIGSSALIDVNVFLEQTAREKWWRWKINRAAKQGFTYELSHPPHDPVFVQALQAVSDAWLKQGGHQERGFALGYFDQTYMSACNIHYLKDQSGRIIAFINQLPLYKQADTQTIDLLRYSPEAKDAMPFLLYKLIESLKAKNYTKFDLGFVPFAGTTDVAMSIAKILSAGRFSSKGLEQFKNKFKPDWYPYYILYDGDLADLAIIAFSLEKVMEAKE